MPSEHRATRPQQTKAVEEHPKNNICCGRQCRTSACIRFLMTCASVSALPPFYPLPAEKLSSDGMPKSASASAKTVPKAHIPAHQTFSIRPFFLLAFPSENIPSSSTCSSKSKNANTSHQSPSSARYAIFPSVPFSYGKDYAPMPSEMPPVQICGSRTLPAAFCPRLSDGISGRRTASC